MGWGEAVEVEDQVENYQLKGYFKRKVFFLTDEHLIILFDHPEVYSALILELPAGPIRKGNRESLLTEIFQAMKSIEKEEITEYSHRWKQWLIGDEDTELQMPENIPASMK